MTAKQRDIRMLQLTSKELSELPSETKVYEGVGKMWAFFYFSSCLVFLFHNFFISLLLVFNFATPKQWENRGNFSLGPFFMKLRLTYHPVPGSSTSPSTQSTSVLRARAARPPLRSPASRRSCNITRRQTKRVGRISSRFSNLVGGREQNVELGIWDGSETWTRCARKWRVSLIVVSLYQSFSGSRKCES